MSIPAATPAEVMMPSSTTRRSRSTLMRSLNDWRRSWAPQCVVARRPSSRPARAKSNEPVHTDVTLRALAATRRIQARVSSSWIRARVPKPPGTTSRSMGGASPNAKCGSTRSPPVVTTGAVDLATVKTRKGALSSLRRASGPGSSRVREKTSNGPAKSSTSTLSKIKIPTFHLSTMVPPRQVLEQRHLRDGLGDLALDRHAHGVGQRHHATLDELIVVGGQGVRRQIPGREAVGHLVEIRVRREEAGEELEPSGPIPALFAQLALSGGARILTGPRAASGKLPRDLAEQVPVLADEQHAVRRHEGQDADGDADREHRIGHFAAVGQPPRILAQGQAAARITRRRRERRPPAGHRGEV